MVNTQPVPQWALPFVGNEDKLRELGLQFNPVWLKWFLDTISQLQSGELISHNSLQSIQGGTATEYYHLTSARYSTLTGNAIANLVFAGPASGVPAVAAFRSLATADLADELVTYAKIQDVSATDKVLGRSTAGAGVVEEIACTAAGRALLDDASASAQRTTLGLGSAALEDYSEGTWTPAFTCATPGDLSVAYSAQSGTWTKMGRIVTVTANIVTSTFTHSTASGNVKITGLSQTPTVTTFDSISAFQGFTSAGYSALAAQVVATVAEIYINKAGSGQTFGGSPIGDWPSGGTVNLYFTMQFVE